MGKWKLEVAGMDKLLTAVGKVEKLLQEMNFLLRANLEAEEDQTQEIADMATDLSALAAEVNENNDVVASAEQVLLALVEELQNAGGNQEEIDAITQQISDQSARLAAAIANVPHPEQHA